jgi:hypothetical protein
MWRTTGVIFGELSSFMYMEPQETKDLWVQLQRSNQTAWSTLEEHNQLKELTRALEGMYWGKHEQQMVAGQELYRTTLKLAWVYLNEEDKEMLYVSNQDQKAYRMDLNNPTEHYKLLEPLQEVSYLRFDRWCTTFDV